MPCGRRNAALFVQIKTLERLQETIGQKLSNPHTVRHFSLCSVLRAGKRTLWQEMVCWNNAMNRVNTMLTTICSRSISRLAP